MGFRSREMPIFIFEARASLPRFPPNKFCFFVFLFFFFSNGDPRVAEAHARAGPVKKHNELTGSLLALEARK